MKVLSALLLLAAYACEQTGTPIEGTSRPRTTEVSPPYAEWSVNSVSAVRIGSVNGAPQSQFANIVDAARLSDGRFVVVDGGAFEVRWYGPDGSFQFQAGGKGEGPGEFLWIGFAVVTPGDSVVLYDARNQRLTWFGPDGSLGRMLRVELTGTVRLIPFGHARLVVVEERPVFNFGPAEFNRARDSVQIMIEPGDSQPLDTVMRREGPEAATWVKYTNGEPRAHMQMGLPFSHGTLVGTISNRLVSVGNDRGDLAFFNEEGNVVRLVHRTDVDPPMVSASLRDEYVKNAVQVAKSRGQPETQARVWAEGLLDLVPRDQRVPAFDRLLTDAVGGTVWLRDYVFGWNADRPQRWTVHDSTGQVLAQLTTPPGLDVMQVGLEHIVGVERDDMGVQYVVEYSRK